MARKILRIGALSSLAYCHLLGEAVTVVPVHNHSFGDRVPGSSTRSAGYSASEVGSYVTNSKDTVAPLENSPVSHIQIPVYYASARQPWVFDRDDNSHTAFFAGAEESPMNVEDQRAVLRKEPEQQQTRRRLDNVRRRVHAAGKAVRKHLARPFKAVGRLAHRIGSAIRRFLLKVVRPVLRRSSFAPPVAPPEAVAVAPSEAAAAAPSEVAAAVPSENAAAEPRRAVSLHADILSSASTISATTTSESLGDLPVPNRELARSVAAFASTHRKGAPSNVALLQAAEAQVELDFPKLNWTIYVSLRDRRSYLLRREPVVGLGAFGVVAPFTSRDGVQYAGKMFRVKTTVAVVEASVWRQMRILERLPQDVDVLEASRRLQLAFPLDVVQIPDTPDLLSQALANIVILFPLLQTDLKSLGASLSPEKDSDRLALLSITKQVIRAVSNLHSLGYVHTDIKPANFLVSSDGVVYLCDLDGVTTMGEFSTLNFMTPMFASPEMARVVIRNERIAHLPYLDSWQLGITIYHLWCKRNPFNFPPKAPPALIPKLMHRVSKLESTAIMFAPECLTYTPKEVVDVIMGFLEINPSLRVTATDVVKSHPVMNLPTGGEEEATAERRQRAPPSSPEESTTLVAGFAGEDTSTLMPQ